MKNAFLLTCLTLLAACAHRKDTTHYRHIPESFTVSSTQSFFIDAQGPSVEIFNAASKAALSGDDVQLAYLLSLARFTDGEGVLAYGTFLGDLKAFVGLERFHHALTTLSSEEQSKVESDMKSAEEMRRWSNH